MLSFIYCDSVGFCSVAVVVVMKGPAVVYDAASLVYDDVFFAVNSKKNEKASPVTVMFLYVDSIPLNCLQTALTVAMNNDWV